jgi:hypothetical protein
MQNIVLFFLTKFIEDAENVDSLYLYRKKEKWNAFQISIISIN